MEFATNLPETVTDFWAVFNEHVTAVQASLEASEDISMEQIATVKSKITELQVYATNSTTILPKYDVRRSQEVRFVLAMCTIVTSCII
jgi:hypothetical protein